MLKIATIDQSILGVKIVYADGSIVKIRTQELEQLWTSAPADGVQVVSIYFKRRFEKGYYCQWFAGRDWYGYSPDKSQIIETNDPSDFPIGTIPKTGSLMEKPQFMDLYNRALLDHEF